jgi:hypothetical protein
MTRRPVCSPWGGARPFGLGSVLAALAVLALAPAAPAASAGTTTGVRARHWVVAAPGPCASVEARNPCAGGACAAEGPPARSRFEPVDVAGAPQAPEPPAPDPKDFGGPGTCADPSLHCAGSPSPNPRPTGVIEPPVVPAPPPPGLP